jgi:Zn-dependent alcohol dehydrogenase
MTNDFTSSSYRPFTDQEGGGAIGFSIFAAPPRVLHIDSDHDAALVLAALLVPETQVTHVPTMAAAQDLLRREQFALVVLDPDLTDGDGAELLAHDENQSSHCMAGGQPLTIEEVELGGPREGEVLVEIKATGICHTDYYTLSGADPEGIFPAILGHEGAGVVVDVGPGVKSLKKDDHVIPLYTPECRQCKFCLSQKTNLCQSIRSTQGRGLMPDATSRFSIDGKLIYHYMGTSTFSNYIVVPEIALAKIREDAPFDKVCYIGCGVTTGVGAVLFTAKVEAGANVVVFGLGGIGLNVIQAARMVGADKIIGVDINPARQEMARKFGMTHFINPKEVDNVVDSIVQLTDGGADYSSSASATPPPCASRWSAATRAGASRSSSAWRRPGRKFPRVRSSW